MKNIFNLFLMVSLMLSVNSVFAKDNIQSDTISVSGNCGMCKSTIQGALQIKGVKYADWNMKTHRLAVKYDTKKITLDEIAKRVAAVGYDNEYHQADDKTYDKLHGCCQYRD